MTSPSPSPQPVPTTGAVGAVAGLINPPQDTSTTSTSSGDLFGLGDWGKQIINPGDLILGVAGTGQKTTGDNIVKAFGHADPVTIASVQRALYLGGYYSKTYTPAYGVVKPEDIAAFGSAVRVAGQTDTPVSSVLLQGAQTGTVAGIAAARAQQTTAKSATGTVTLPNTQDLEAEAVKTFNSVLGRNATPKEAAAFAAVYRNMSAGIQRANNQAQYDATNPSGQSAGITGHQAAAATKAAESVGQAPKLAPYSGPNPKFQGDYQTSDGKIVAYQSVGPDLAAPGTLSKDPQQLVVVDPSDPDYGKPYHDTTPSFSAQLASLGAVAQQVQQEATPPTTGGGLTQVEEQTPESPTVAAENFAENTAPKRFAAKSVAGQFDNFLSLLTQSFGG